MAKKDENPIEAIEGMIESEAKELKREFRHFERFRDENSLLFGVFVLAVTALVVINTFFWVQYTSKRYEKQNRQTTTIANLLSSTSLQTAHNFAVSARVSNVAEKNDKDPAFTLADDETLLVMDITITNRTTETQHLIPVNQLYVRSNEGDYDALHASMFVTKPLVSQDLNPGQSASGQISFGIPKRVDTPLLYIDTGWGTSTPLVIDVLH